MADSTLESIDEVYGQLELEDIRFEEFSARRIDDEVEERVTASSKAGPEGDSYIITMMMEATGHGAEYRVAARAVYRATSSFDWSEELQLTFARHSALQTLTPFLREAFMTLGQRIERPAPLFPLQNPNNPDALFIDFEPAHKQIET